MESAQSVMFSSVSFELSETQCKQNKMKDAKCITTKFKEQ